MDRRLQQLFLLALTLAVIVSVATALPVLFGGHLQGQRLLVHMMASGVIVTTLPLFAIFQLVTRLGTFRLSVIEQVGFWSLVVFGFLTIGTMFIGMLPVVSTPTMNTIIELHGWTGFTTAASLVVVLIGRFRQRSLQPSSA